MGALRASGARALALLLILSTIAAAAAAEPKTYVFTGKLTSNRGPFVNIPVFGNVNCKGAGLANLTVMQGPGGKLVPAPNTPPTRTPGKPASGFFGCVKHVPGKEITTTGAGVGGAFVMPTKVFSRPQRSYVAAASIPGTPLIQLATSFNITGPRKTPTTPMSGSMGYTFPPAAPRAFKKGAWITQTGREGSMFTWCWGNPGCGKITQGTKPLIVKYSGGGNAFGGTMAFVLHALPPGSSLAIGWGGGAVGFARITGMGSQPTGRGYAFSLTEMHAKGPLWAQYRTMSTDRPYGGGQKLITMVTGFLGSNFPAAYHYNFGFPWTTMTVLARNTGTQAGNPKVTTLTAKGGDTVTAMGKRNLSLVAGGVARMVVGPLTLNTPEIGQMYLPEPGRAPQLLAGALALLTIASLRAQRCGRE